MEEDFLGKLSPFFYDRKILPFGIALTQYRRTGYKYFYS